MSKKVTNVVVAILVAAVILTVAVLQIHSEIKGSAEKEAAQEQFKALGSQPMTDAKTATPSPAGSLKYGTFKLGSSTVKPLGLGPSITACDDLDQGPAHSKVVCRGLYKNDRGFQPKIQLDNHLGPLATAAKLEELARIPASFTVLLRVFEGRVQLKFRGEDGAVLGVIGAANEPIVFTSRVKREYGVDEHNRAQNDQGDVYVQLDIEVLSETASYYYDITYDFSAPAP